MNYNFFSWFFCNELDMASWSSENMKILTWISIQNTSQNFANSVAEDSNNEILISQL